MKIASAVNFPETISANDRVRLRHWPSLPGRPQEGNRDQQLKHCKLESQEAERRSTRIMVVQGLIYIELSNVSLSSVLIRHMFVHGQTPPYCMSIGVAVSSKCKLTKAVVIGRTVGRLHAQDRLVQELPSSRIQ